MPPFKQDPDADPHALRRRRLLFRATHRGTYENDILIGGFVRARLQGFDAEALDALDALMDLPDAELGDWLTGRAPIPAAHDRPMLRAIRASAEAGEGRPAGVAAGVPTGVAAGVAAGGAAGERQL